MGAHPPVHPAAAGERPLHVVALDYLRQALGPAFEGMAPPARAPAGDEGARGPREREWSRRWRRLCLPDLLAAYAHDLAGARTAEQVYAVVPEHAVHIVGAYTALFFVPDGAGPLRALPNRRLPRADRLRLPALRRARRVTGPDAAAPGGRFAALGPLFSEVGADAVACAPLGRAGTVALVERRRGRVFDGEDWAVLALLAVEGQAALQRVRACARISALAAVDPVTGLAGRPQLDAVLEHAWRLVDSGEPVSLALLALEAPGAARADGGAAVAERLLRAAADALRASMPPEGTALCYGPGELLLVLPGRTPAQAAAVVSALRHRLSLQVQVHAGIAGPFPEARGPRDLLQGARAALPRRAREGA